ncbi:MAG: hypothetical protein J6D29_03840 [Solobacterium sp.]|nr:hypothetical protein [Solobacterium sp.]
MNKLWKLGLSSILVYGLASCGNKTEAVDPNFEWSRQGVFQSEDESEMMMVYKSETPGYEGWSVGYYAGEEVHGWIIQQEGNTLHGNLTAPGEGEEYIVTVKESGEKDLLLITPDGKEHTFKPKELPPVVATMTVNTEGLGRLAYAREGEEVVFDENFPTQSIYEGLAEPTTFTITAKPDEGWKFVKWKLNGEDYSTEDTITVHVDQNMDLVAVFEFEN